MGYALNKSERLAGLVMERARLVKELNEVMTEIVTDEFYERLNKIEQLEIEIEELKKWIIQNY